VSYETLLLSEEAAGFVGSVVSFLDEGGSESPTASPLVSVKNVK
jgi:hypothetical protein